MGSTTSWAEPGGRPASFARMKEKIIKTRPLTAQSGRLRPRVGVGGSPVPLQSRDLSAITFLFSGAGEGLCSSGPLTHISSEPHLLGAWR